MVEGPEGLLLEKLHNAKVDDNVVMSLRTLYDGMALRVNGEIVKTNVGVVQGGITSPLTFNLMINELIQKVDPVVIFGYAERLPLGRGFRLRLEAADPELFDPDVGVSCTALNAQVERMVMQHPLQYEWTYKRFGARPDGTDFQYDQDPFTEPPVS